MSISSDERNPVELLAEEFLERKRRGEQPTLREYVERHPQLADEIRDLFPALLVMEDLGESSGATTGSLATGDGVATGITLQRLGDYRILREIGRGGMGVVYEAEQESLGRRVALKVLSAGALLDPKQVRRFEREARAAARLHHTNIVPVFGVGNQDGHHYFVMQFIVGLGLDLVLEDLRRLRRVKSVAGPQAAHLSAASRITGLTAADVARSMVGGHFPANRPIADGSVTEPCHDSAPALASETPVGLRATSLADSSASLPGGSSGLSGSSDPDRQFYRSVARVGIQVAEALDYANRQGILHRDIKPSNLLLDNHGNVWVADFGLAKTAEADDLTHTGDIVGTIRYMAPERFSGHCDARSDVYSLGLTLYELVSLQPAYQASDRHSLMDRVLHQEPERLRRLAPSVPRDLDTIVAKAMAREPEKRYATAAALAEDLRRFVDDRPIRARRISPAERLARWCRRNKGLAASIGVATTALVVSLALSLLYADRQTRHAAEQVAANKSIAQLASDLEKESTALRSERASLKTALTESNRRLARLDLERGQAAFEKGQIGAGMLWTVESLRMAAQTGDEAGKHVALANLSAWRRHHLEPKEVFSHSRTVGAVAFSPDGKTVLTGSHDGTARLWDAAGGQPVGPPMEHPGDVSGRNSVWSAAFSPDGKTVLTGCDDGVRFWDAATSRPVGQPLAQSGRLYSVAFSPDGKALVAAGGAAPRLWDAVTRRPIGQPLASSSMMVSVAFSRDGKTVLTGSHDRTARQWDAATGQPIGPPIEHPDAVWSVAFSPDGKTVLTGGFDKTARQWDAATGRPIGPPLRHLDWVRTVTFSPDGKTILTGSSDNTAQLWDAATGQRIGSALEHQAAVWSVAFAPDGRSILTGSQDGMARLWAADVGQPVGRALEYGSEMVVSLALVPDGKTLLVAGFDGKVRRWDLTTGELRGEPVELEPGVWCMALSPDGKTIVTGSLDKSARQWDAASGQPVGPPMQHSESVGAVAFSPDGKRILTGSSDKTAQLWDAASGQPIGGRLTHSDAVLSVAFSPDGKTILTGCGDRTARRWDAATGRSLGPPLEHWGNVNSVAFSPDGKKVLTGSNDKTARQWDAGTGEPVGPPLAHSGGGVWSVAFSPDGKTILTGSLDSAARLWDAATGQPIGPPMRQASSTHASNLRVFYSPDVRSLVTSDFRAARQWAAPAALPDDVPRLVAWVEAITGLELDEQGSIRVLDRTAWLARRSRLEQLGGPPPADPAPRLDPTVYGGDPSARGDAWKEQGLWDRAASAYAEAIRARPLNSAVRLSLARLFVERGQLDGAARLLAEAVRMIPDDLVLHRGLCCALLLSGDRAGWRRANAALLDRTRQTTNWVTAEAVTWSCVLAPNGTADPEAPFRMVDAAIRGLSDDSSKSLLSKSRHLNALGAALYRAGRCDEAVHRLEEYIRFRGGASQPTECAFLAMANQRLGHRDLALHWLDRLQNHRPTRTPTSSGKSWRSACCAVRPRR